MKQSLWRRNGFWLILSLVLILVSAVGASLVQTAGGSVVVKDLKWETSSGRAMSALLFKPAGATADDPAPAVVVSHGWWNNREMQDANYVELARRGYVVVSIDMYGHGNSDPLPADELQVGGTGMYDAVQLVADLPYVDHDRIGVSGHSNGARAANFAVAIDDEADEQLISAVFLVDNEAMYTDEDKAFANNYGTRDVGLVADQYDEFFFRSYGETVTPPREFATTPNAQSFLYFGEEPGAEVREPGEYYSQEIDGVEAVRVLYTPPQTHPWGTISSGTVADQLDFFETAFGAPEAIDSHAQVWQVKEAFTTVGLVGFGIFLVAFARALLALRPFTRLRLEQAPAMVDPGRTGRAWFWGGLVVSALVSGASYIWLSQAQWLSAIAYSGSALVPQGAVFFIAFWAAVNGVAGLVIMGASYLAFGRRNGSDLRASGVLPGWRNLGLGVLLALVTTAAAFTIVFAVDYFFKTDFRLWVLAVKWFSPDKIGYALLVLPLFLIYFVANSIAINAFNRFALAGREWVNTAVLALFNSLAPIVLVVVQYTTFAATGELVPGFGGIFSIWLFPVIVILAVSAVISRKLYRATGNPYIAGVLNASVVALISASNTLVLTY
ncbi:prolyl oligopeptidase family serine peptidase [Protaetiibacter sp. SSC-01]|uniref:alpha/beta hydrolase family protein n=1 Tax=Protaetiibacter sp. SSC-01 TaxID=2759943 RepID=UPI001656CEC1|nr:alpha/beta fold hydrolase [Protaetiibacter sp. SSC-01]QNO36826.1 prolyl oligopeptidase family serine peptidase [Protaetiibacter sp. SSC-01]